MTSRGSVDSPILLDLFCGAGGAAEGYARAGFRVIGVDIKPQPNYPFEFYCKDALEHLRSEMKYGCGDLAAIHASPPCQAHSTLRHRTTRAYPDLIAPTREHLVATGLPYVIENVVGAPLLNPIRLCGSSFGLGVRRHRCFESNVALMALPCAHHLQKPRFDVYEHGVWIKSPVARVYGHGGGKGNAHWNEAMGINWMTPREITQAIPPAYTEHIGGQLMAYLTTELEAAA